MSEESLKQIHGGTTVVSDIGYRLQYISEALYSTGNSELGDKLAVMSGRLLSASDDINKGSGGLVHMLTTNAEQSSTNLLATCLAMSTLGERSTQLD